MVKEISLISIIIKTINRIFQITRNFLLRNKIYYVVENKDWVINEIAKSLKAHLGEKYKITFTHKGIRNSTIHYGSIGPILSKNGISLPHLSNKIIVTYYHIVPNDDRLKYVKELIEVVNMWHTSNSFSKKQMIKIGIPESKIKVIPLAIDLEKFHKIPIEDVQALKIKLGLPNNKIIIGSFQKDGDGWGEGLNPKLIKGPDVFCDIIEKLKINHQIFVLLTGPSRGYVKKRLENSSVPFKHIYLKDQDEIKKLYYLLDFYFITSRVEGGPMAVLESFASGVPIISTKVGMAKDIINHGQNGSLVDVEDVNMFVEEFESLVKNQVKIENQIKNGLLTVLNYDWKIISEQMDQLYFD